MAILKIRTYPDPILKRTCKSVETIDQKILGLLQNMAETMYAAPGIGLAANQVGVLRRVVVVDTDHPEGEPKLIVLVNPEIVARSGELVWEEGFLSFLGHLVPGRFLRIEAVMLPDFGDDGLVFAKVGLRPVTWRKHRPRA